MMYIIPACAVYEDMLISIDEDQGKNRSSDAYHFHGELDVVSAYSGRPTEHDLMNAADLCVISGSDPSTNEGMTILVLDGSSLLVIYYEDDQTSVRVHDHD